MTMNKSELRKICLKKRSTLPKRELTAELFANDENFKKAKTVFCYISYKNEIKTHNFIREILKTKTVVVPKCTDKNGNMICVRIQSFSELKPGAYGIFEPKDAICFDKNKIDYAIVPGVAFDKSGNRIGYGKGYYDRFLAGIAAKKVGICHSELLLDAVPGGEFDIKMDKIICLP